MEIFVEKLPRKIKAGVETFTSIIGASLFALITWQSLAYAADLRHSGEVSVTLTMPIYPFIYGIAAGSGLLCLVLVLVAEMGVITPPVGINVYVVAGVARDVPLQVIFRGAANMIFALCLTTILLIIFPQIALFLPGFMK